MSSTLRWKSLIPAALIALPGAAYPAAPDLPEDGMIDLSPLVGGTWSHAYGINGAGDRIVGTLAVSGTLRAFIVDPEDLNVIVPSLLPGGFKLDARAISRDGTTVVGEGDGLSSFVPPPSDRDPAPQIANGNGTYSGRIAFRWTEGTDTVSLGTIQGGSWSAAYGVNANGTVVVGWAGTSDGNMEAFRWTDEGMASLGILDGIGRSGALDVSNDGNTVVGFTGTVTDSQAFRFTVQGRMVGLGFLPGGTYSEAWGVNADGTVVVGLSNSDVGQRAFRWAEGTGMISLGVLDGGSYSTAQAVNDDGNVVVGWSGSSDGMRAFHWADGTGMQNIGVLDGDTWSYALGVNAAGDIVVGASGTSETARAFSWRDGALIDIENTREAVQQAAQSVGAASAHYNSAAHMLLNREIDLRGPGDGSGEDGGNSDSTLSSQGSVARAPIALSFGAGMSHNSNVGTLGAVDVTGAMGLGAGYTLGGTLVISHETAAFGPVTLDGTHVSGGLSLRWHADPASRTGLTWRAAAMAGSGTPQITRSAILPNTESGSGNAQLSTFGASAEIGWGIRTGDTALVTPYLRLSHAATTRAAYTESDSIGFPLTFDAHRHEATTITLGAVARFDIGPRSSMQLGAGVSHDLGRSNPAITGTSAIPGFQAFSVGGPALVNQTRYFIDASYHHAISRNAALTGTVALSQSPWSTTPSLSGRLAYEIRF